MQRGQPVDGAVDAAVVEVDQDRVRYCPGRMSTDSLTVSW